MFSPKPSKLTRFYFIEIKFFLGDIHVNLPTGRLNSPVFLGHLPISNILPNSPDFYMFLPYSPDFYMFMSQMCDLHHVHLGQGSKMQFEWYTCGILNPLHTAEVFYSHFKLCFNNFIYPPLVDYFTVGWWLFEYLLASTVNFKIYIFKINQRKYGSLFVPHKRKKLCRYNDIYVVLTTSDGCRYNEILSRYNDILSRYNDILSRYNDLQWISL